MILLDTCAVATWTLDEARLTRRARTAIARESTVALSSISIGEIGIEVKRGKLELPLTLEDDVASLRTVRGAIALPVDEPVWIRNLSPNGDHRDPPDPTIVATAVREGCRLVTSDRTMTEFSPKCVW